MVDARPFDVFDKESFQCAPDVSDEVDRIKENGATADFGGEGEFFAFDKFDSDEHEDEIDEREGGEHGEESSEELATDAEFDETAEEHDDDTDEDENNRLDADGFAAEAAAVVGTAGFESAAHEGDVFATGGEVALNPASALGDGLGEFGGLLVVKDGGFVIEGGEAVEGGVEGEFVIFGQAVERPATPFFDDVAVDIEASAGENNIAAAAGAFFVADSVNHGKGEAGDGSDDVGAGVFAVAIAGGELVAGAVGVEDFFEIIGRKAVVGVEDEISVIERGLGGGSVLIVGEDLF